MASPATDADRWAACMRSCVLTRELTRGELKFIFTNARLSRYAAGDVVYEEGSPSECFYFVHSGSFSYDNVASHMYRLQREGVAFGAAELLVPQPREATVRCVDAGALWMVPRRVFDAKMRVAPPIKPAFERFLHACPLFAALPREQLQHVARAAREVRLRIGVNLCEQGDDATTVYAIRSGVLESSQREAQYRHVMRAPSCFGEAALYSDGEGRKRAASVACIADPISVGGAAATDDNDPNLTKLHTVFDYEGAVRAH